MRGSVVRGGGRALAVHTRQQAMTLSQRYASGGPACVLKNYTHPDHNVWAPISRTACLSCLMLSHQHKTLAPNMTMGRTRHAGVFLVLAALTTMAVIPGVGAFSGGLRVAITQQQPHDCSMAAASSTVSPRPLNPEGNGVCALSIDGGSRLPFTAV